MSLIDKVRDRLADINTRRSAIADELDAIATDPEARGLADDAAITARLSRGEPLEQAVEGARAYLRRGLERPLRVAGRDFISHGV